MYCNCKEFQNQMSVYIEKIEKGSNRILIFVEYIVLPYFGNVILRFDIAKESYTLAELDAYEAFMQKIVQDDFVVDFMGHVYQKVGFEPSMFEEAFIKCYHKYSNTTIVSRDDRAMLNNDAIFLLQTCGLSVNTKVWEIQMEEETAFYTLGNRNQKIGTFPFGDSLIHVYEAEEMTCTGLMRACMYAKEQQISIVHVLLEV